MTNDCTCKMHEESPGVMSSKRVWGTIMLTLGCMVGLGSVILSYVTGTDSKIAIDVMNTFIVGGSALLGITVLEGIPSAIAKRVSQ